MSIFARSRARLTSALVTPSTRDSALLTRDEHAAHVMPVRSREMRLFMSAPGATASGFDAGFVAGVNQGGYQDFRIDILGSLDRCPASCALDRCRHNPGRC